MAPDPVDSGKRAAATVMTNPSSPLNNGEFVHQPTSAFPSFTSGGAAVGQAGDPGESAGPSGDIREGLGGTDGGFPTFGRLDAGTLSDGPAAGIIQSEQATSADTDTPNAFHQINPNELLPASDPADTTYTVPEPPTFWLMLGTLVAAAIARHAAKRSNLTKPAGQRESIFAAALTRDRPG